MRIVFNICVTNTDDHLRNHGFILTDNGWVISPAYDINPIENGNGLKLNINEDDNSQNVDLALEVAPYFRIEEKEANQIVDSIVQTVASWKTIAIDLGISRNEAERMDGCFLTEKE